MFVASSTTTTVCEVTDETDAVPADPIETTETDGADFVVPPADLKASVAEDGRTAPASG